MRRLEAVAGGAVLVCLGLLSALLLAGCGGGGQAAGAVSTALSNVSVTRPAATVTEQAPATPPSTVTQVATVTAPAVTAPATTSAQLTITTVQPESTSTGDVSPWAWVLLGLGAIAVVAIIVYLLRHRELSLDERQKRLFTALSGWTTRGWTVDQQSADSAVLSRDGEHVRVTVDGRGEVASNRLVPG